MLGAGGFEANFDTHGTHGRPAGRESRVNIVEEIRVNPLSDMLIIVREFLTELTVARIYFHFRCKRRRVGDGLDSSRTAKYLEHVCLPSPE